MRDLTNKQVSDMLETSYRGEQDKGDEIYDLANSGDERFISILIRLQADNNPVADEYVKVSRELQTATTEALMRTYGVGAKVGTLHLVDRLREKPKATRKSY